MKNKIMSLLILASLVLMAGYALSQPTGADIRFNQSETKNASPAEYLNTSGGSFTTIILYGESQNLKWKAYAGNVTGALVLDDADDYSIYQWEQTTLTGQVYASRNNSVEWSSIGCANVTHVANEEDYMNHTTSAFDSINNTFKYNTHKSFSVGTEPILNSTCKATYTWVNDAAQSPSENAKFQEVLLYDGSSLVYTTFINDDTVGFNAKTYDFQMIVAERGVGGYAATPYYFYVELQ